MTDDASVELRADRGKVRLEDRILAEAVAQYETDAGSTVPGARQATEAARRLEAPLESRIVHRARLIGETLRLPHSIERSRMTLRWLIAAGVALFAILGAGTVRTTLGSADRDPVNFYLVLGGVLGVQTLLLVGWLLLMLINPRGMSGGSLGGWILHLTQGLIRKWSTGAADIAAITAIGRVLSRLSIARWSLSSITHALWLAFNLGALLSLIYLLSARHYVFVWETTILDSNAYAFLTDVIASLPRAAGFAVPSAEQIAASEWMGTDAAGAEAARVEWSSLLVGCVVLYGFGPRVLLLGLSMSLRRSALARYRLDMERPEFMRLRSMLSPPSLVATSEDQPAPIEPRAAPTDHRRRGEGPVAMLAFEVDPQIDGWPPRVSSVESDDLGAIVTRDDQRRAISDVESREHGCVAVVCDLANTPDRGATVFIEEVRRATAAPVAVILTGGQRMRERSGAESLSQRIEDWTAAAGAGGVASDDVLAVDLDHLTGESTDRLSAFLGGEPRATTTPAGKIEAACELIIAHVSRTTRDPLKAQGELHGAIVKLYGGAFGGWRRAFNIDAESANWRESIVRSADRVHNLLPQRLRLSPGWITAGTITGALGCVTAAALVSPVAISALPMWSLIGGALGGLLRNIPGRHAAGDQADTPQLDLADRVRSAALFATLLELQGRDEKSISRILDQVASDSDAESMNNAEAAREWLDEWKHRLNLALAGDGVRHG